MKEYRRGGATVFVQTTNLNTFDPSSCIRIAKAQSYSLTESTATENVIDIGDPNTLAENPVGNGTSWNGNLNSLVTRDIASLPVGQEDVSLGSMIEATTLKNNTNVWIIFGDVDNTNTHLANGSVNPYRYGKAIITNRAESQNGNSIGTLDVTFTGKGELFYSA
ncbi:MAG: hypothetical protein HC831_14495 [Chloroflexia bacterium]|nr:hypothetical protein [Chloroflexia bacterium]